MRDVFRKFARVAADAVGSRAAFSGGCTCKRRSGPQWALIFQYSDRAGRPATRQKRLNSLLTFPLPMKPVMPR